MNFCFLFFREIIAIDQDTLGKMGKRVYNVSFFFFSFITTRTKKQTKVETFFKAY